MALPLNRKYKLSSSDKFNDYMKALGVGLVTRKMGNSITPVITLTEEDGEYTLSSHCKFKSWLIRFRLGQEFYEETPDGRKVKSTITQEGNKLVHIQKGKKETTIVREFSEDEVKVTLMVDNIVSTRIYKSVE